MEILQELLLNEYQCNLNMLSLKQIYNLEDRSQSTKRRKSCIPSEKETKSSMLAFGDSVTLNHIGDIKIAQKIPYGKSKTIRSEGIRWKYDISLDRAADQQG